MSDTPNITEVSLTDQSWWDMLNILSATARRPILDCDYVILKRVQTPTLTERVNLVCNEEYDVEEIVSDELPDKFNPEDLDIEELL